jgi:hypothetical protein
MKQVEMRFLGYIQDLKDKDLQLQELFSEFIPPHGSDDNSVYITLRRGKCFLETQELCDAAEYDPSVGYTKQLAESGIDNQMIIFLKTSEEFLNSRNFTSDNPKFILLEHLSDALVKILPEIAVQLKSYTKKSVDSSTAILFSVMVLVLGALYVVTYVGIL